MSDLNKRAALAMGWEASEGHKGIQCYLKKNPMGYPNAVPLTLVMPVKDFDPLTRWDHAGMLVEKAGVLVGSWEGTDGFFHLQYGEFADHTIANCDIDKDIDGTRDDDPEPWSAHFHIGGINADNTDIPDHWECGDTFCSRGKTAPEAITRAFCSVMEEANGK